MFELVINRRLLHFLSGPPTNGYPWAGKRVCRAFRRAVETVSQ